MFRLIPSSPVSASAINGAFLENAMEARAHNLRQYDPSAAVDSHLERIQALALRLPPGPEREELLLEVEAAIDSNLEEAYAELALCCAADQLVSDLRFGERNGSRQVFGAKAIARHLRPPLDILSRLEGRPPAEIVEARHKVREAIAEIPRLMLLSPAVAHELGAAKFRVLRELTEKSAAAGSSRDGAEAEHGSARNAAD
jgi:hypothetical protein